MKSYVDLEQSRKLTEILPLESADMCYIKGKAHLGFLYEEYKEAGDSVLQDYEPCWSLAALLSLIPYVSLEEYNGAWSCNSYDKETHKHVFGKVTGDSIDACYEMIVKLHELNLL